MEVRRIMVFAAMLLACACTKTYDVVVIGGGTGGAAAGIEAARLGARTLIIEEGPWLGGMLTSAGVSATDGNHRLRGGLFGEFADSLAGRYGSMQALSTGWVSNMLFEPYVGAEIFDNICSAEPNLSVVKNGRYGNIEKCGRGWNISYTDADGTGFKVRTRMLIDGTELGDVAAGLGVPCSIGLDSKAETGESIALDSSCRVVQDLTYVAILKDYGYDVTIPAPEGYNPDIYRNSAICPAMNKGVSRNPVTGLWTMDDTGQNLSTPDMMLSYGRLPSLSGRAKYMINWPGEGNDTFVDIIDMTPDQREHALDSAKRITLGFVHYMQTVYGFNTLGLADDEYPTKDLLPIIPYHRESRRIYGEVRFVLEDIARPYRNMRYRTGIAVGDYPVDHHHYRNPHWMDIPKMEFYPVPSYSVPMGVVIPKGFDNLLVVDKSISVTNLVNGTTRLQPVVMLVGQAAGAMAALTVKKGKRIGVRELQTAILDYGGYIMPYLDLPASDPSFKTLQRIGATGIMRGEGRSVGWSNETRFRASDPVKKEEVYLEDYYPGKTFSDLGLPEPDGTMTRLQMARKIDSLLHPFETFEVDIEGNIVRK